jgi:hypothetical protein
LDVSAEPVNQGTGTVLERTGVSLRQHGPQFRLGAVLP